MIVNESLQKEAKERILIIDDDEDIRYSTTLFLKKHNYKIEVAKDGQDGLEKIAEKFYNLVILDIKLPDIDGNELIILIKEKRPDTEIIMITGAADINSAIKSLNAGVSAYLNKPLNLDELLAHIRNSIEKQRLINDKRKAERALRMSQQVLALKTRISAIFLTISDEGIYHETLSLVLKELKSKYGVFGYIDENGDYICPSMTRDVWEECDVPNKEIIYPRKSWSSGNTIWGRALISGEPIYLNNPFKVPKGHIQINRTFAAPIRYKDEVIGLILVGNKKTDYDDNDVKLLESITEYIAPILHARLQRDLEEKQRKRAEHDLGERVKELMCLYSISRLIENTEISIEQFFTKLLTFIPPAWQFPEVTCAKITYKERIFKTENFQEAQWKQIAEFKEEGKKVGTVEIIYFEEMPEFDEGPFLNEERDLINGIAEHLSIFIERKRTEKQIADLAKFPSENPNPVLRVTRERVFYTNKKGGSLFNVKKGDKIPRMLEEEVCTAFDMNTVNKVEIELNNCTYSLIITPIIEEGYLNIYGMDITERKKAEQEIKESEAKFRALFNNTNDSIFIHERGRHFIEVNKTACERLGYSKEELLKLAPKDIIPPGYKIDLQTKIKSLYEKGELVVESEHMSKDGDRIPVEINSRIFNYRGKNTIISTARDITKRKIVELEIQQRTIEISALFKASRAILEYNDSNKATRAIFDSCVEILGVSVGYITLLAADQEKHQKVFLNPRGVECKVVPNLHLPLRGFRSEVIQYKKALYHNDIPNSDWAKLMPKGHISIKNIMVAPLIINNKVQGLFGLGNKEGDFNDEDTRLVTAFAELASIALLNTQTLDSLEKSEEKYRNLSNILEQKVEERSLELAAIYEYAPIMLILLDKERRVLKVNKATLEFAKHIEQKIIGLRSGEALRCLNSLDDPRGCGFGQECQTCKFRIAFLDSFKTGKKYIDVEIKLPFMRNGEKVELNLLVSTIPLIIHDERLVLASINDITSLKKAEKKLQKSEEKVLNLINNISDVLIEASMDGIITFISPQIYNIVNYKPDELMGQDLLNLSHPEDKRMLETFIRSAINSGDLIDINLRILHKKGFYVPISIRGTLVKTDDELKIFAVVSDISERNRVEDMMKREVKQLKEID
ncbi:MAG TPA: PAS domain S-box protein, partial [archaeon]|nr:PAS domain S-box protein [archaeon]